MYQNRRVQLTRSADGSLVVRVTTRTDTGRLRSHNEDAVLVLDGIYVVADGMGGHAAGDRASALTVETLACLADSSGSTGRDVVAAVQRANDAILAEATRYPERSGMGTTVVGLVATTFGRLAHWIGFNVGDSRLYELTADEVKRLSVDHSEVQELLDAHKITEEEALTHPLRHIVTRSLGSDPCPPVDVWMFPVSGGRTYLLCSDGLTDELTDSQVHELFKASSDIDAIADSLIAAALEAGGRDNVSVVVIQVESLAGTEAGDEADTSPRTQHTPTAQGTR